jgi:WhiB family redox-sensing transcriptional regulator
MFATELNEELTDTIRPADPWADAACRDFGGEATSLWFSEQIPDIAAAKGICGTCTLIVPCFEGAVERREPWGVWGGQLFANGKVLAQKRKRGRPPKNPVIDEDIALTA